MGTVVVTEIEKELAKELIPDIPDAYTFDVGRTPVHDCIGCWSCWWKTPGRCAFHDLDEFYHHYITAEKAIFFVEVSRGFVSGRIKTLFDRMIPLYLPYTTHTTGESMHVPRYDAYPEIEFYYHGSFATENGRSIFEHYIERVFYQFYNKLICVKPVEEIGSTREQRSAYIRNDA